MILTGKNRREGIIPLLQHAFLHPIATIAFPCVIRDSPRVLYVLILKLVKFSIWVNTRNNLTLLQLTSEWILYDIGDMSIAIIRQGDNTNVHWIEDNHARIRILLRNELHECLAAYYAVRRQFYEAHHLIIIIAPNSI